MNYRFMVTVLYLVHFMPAFIPARGIHSLCFDGHIRIRTVQLGRCRTLLATDTRLPKFHWTTSAMPAKGVTARYYLPREGFHKDVGHYLQ